jgi:dihydrofolate reductase
VRKIVASLFISLDGVVEAPEKWNFAYFNDEMGQAVGAQMAKSDTLLLGRRTYQDFAAAFANQGNDDPMAAVMNNIPKLVVSTTLDKVEWQNSTLVRGDVAAELAAIKERPGKDISISGSTTLVRSLFELGLLDELQLLIHPIVLGNGQRLFADGTSRKPLKLLDSKTFSTGVVHLTYQPVNE